jgi:hypothetical protein
MQLVPLNVVLDFFFYAEEKDSKVFIPNWHPVKGQSV